MNPVSDLSIEIWPLERIKPYPKNARKITPEAIEMVAKSIEEFGWQQPIVVDDAGVIIAGHARRAAAEKRGWPEAPVHVARNLTPTQVRHYRLMDNRSHEEARWDMEILAIEMQELGQLELSMDLTGFSAQQIADIQAPKQGETDPDEAPATPAAATTRPGDLWVLGDHRVICGNSTDVATVARLMNGDRAQLIFTDPPYGVNFGEANHNPRAKRWAKIQGDADAGDPLMALVTEAFHVAQAHAVDACPVYCWSASMAAGYDMLLSLQAAGLHIQSQLAWVKNTIVLGQADYQWRHEICWYGWTPGKNHFWVGGRSQSTVWEIAKDANSAYAHPAQKPTALSERAIDNSCPAGGIVLDMFGGSGSTLIGAERKRRRARLVELEPAYVDVIVITVGCVSPANRRCWKAGLSLRWRQNERPPAVSQRP